MVNRPVSNQPSEDETREIKNIRSLLLRDPHNSEAWLRLADVLHDPEKVKECLLYAVKFNPGDVEAHARLASLIRPLEAPAPAVTRFCPACGQPNPQEHFYCVKCGSVLPRGPAAAPSAAVGGKGPAGDVTQRVARVPDRQPVTPLINTVENHVAAYPSDQPQRPYNPPLAADPWQGRPPERYVPQAQPVIYKRAKKSKAPYIWGFLALLLIAGAIYWISNASRGPNFCELLDCSQAIIRSTEQCALSMNQRSAGIQAMYIIQVNLITPTGGQGRSESIVATKRLNGWSFSEDFWNPSLTCAAFLN